MRVYKNEFERLKDTKAFVAKKFKRFGVNKIQELTRLLYEISKRENVAVEGIFSDTRQSPRPNYDNLKKFLVSKRYLYAGLHEKHVYPYLPKIELNPSQEISFKKTKFYPKNIYIEKAAAESFLALRVKSLFPRARVLEIESLKGYVCGKVFGEDKIRDYNNRRDLLFIVNEKYDFFKRCPCTKLAFGCGYHIFNLGFGCVFDCTYCFLQDYANFPGIVLPANIGSFFDRFSFYCNDRMRVGTGEFSDSLALDDITGYAPEIIEFFRKHKKAVFEFKTKSVNIENLLKTARAGNIVVSWSLNPQRVIDGNEFFTPSLKQRLNAACKCVQAGYKVGFHFDPLIYFSGWKNEYAILLDELFNKIKPKHIAWISLGTFRFKPALKTVIEKRFPVNRILDEELLPGYDDKLRYPYNLRLGIYKKMLDMFLKHGAEKKVYLCMEDILMWKDLKMKMPKLVFDF